MKYLAVNKNTYRTYEILKTYETGIELKGFEVKTISKHGVSLKSVYAIIKEKEIWLVNLNIPPYQPNNTPKEYNQKRERRLLLKKIEIIEIINKIKQKGLTLIPIKMYNKKSRIKLELGIAKNRKEYDKRETIKKRDIEREMKRKEKSNF